MRLKTIILFILLLSVSCRKEKTFQVQIVNPVTGEGHPNSTVYITETSNSSDCLYCSPEAEEFYAGTTDENGVLTISEDFHKKYKYTLYIGTDVESCHTEGFHEGRNTSGPKIVLDNDNLAGSTVLFEVVPCAGLKYEIQNANCLGTNDFFQLFFEGTQIGYLENQKNTVFVEGTGCYSYMPSSTQVPSGDWYFRQEITKNGVKEVIYDTIALVAGQDYTYTINY